MWNWYNGVFFNSSVVAFSWDAKKQVELYLINFKMGTKVYHQIHNFINAMNCVKWEEWYETNVNDET